MSHLRSSVVLGVIFLFISNNINKAEVLCEGLKSVSAGEQHSLALSDANCLFACGDNSLWQAGLGADVTGVLFLKQVKGENGVGLLENIVAYDAGWTHSLAADVNRVVFAWGNDSVGQLGNGTGREDMEFPGRVRGAGGDGFLSNIIYVSAGRSGMHSLAVDSNGYVYAWGKNDFGQCGDGTYVQKDTPVLVLDDNPQTTGVYLGDIAHIIQADAGENHSIALDSNGYVWHWGEGSSVYPVKVRASASFGGQPLSEINQISSYDHSTAVGEDGFVWEWGFSDQAYKVPGGETGTQYLQNIAEVSAGHMVSMARTKDGRVVEWAASFMGEESWPTYVPDGEMQTQSGQLEGIVSINAGGYYYFGNTRYKLAISQDGRGWAWGNNTYGQLGVNDTIERSEPALMFCAGVSDSNGIIYVDKDATGGLKNGNSWDNAYLVLDDALYEADIVASALGGCEIWVAEGTYKPTVEGVNYTSATFRIPQGNIAIRGHFGGIGVYETSPDQRDFNNFVYETILSGNFGAEYYQKSYYVVTCDDIGAGLVLDGFTITGSSEGDGMYIFGAGMLIDNYSAPSLVRCRFKNNGLYGIYARNFSYPDVADCVFLENDAPQSDAGIRSIDSAWPYVKNCVFDGNNGNSYALKGEYTEMLVEDCIIKRQSYSYPEGSIYFENSSYLALTGCKIENNSYGGVNCSNVQYIEVTDCSIKNNRSGIRCSSSYLEVTDCTIQGNSINGIESLNASVPKIQNSKICLNNGSGIYIDHCGNINIKNNWIYLNGDYETDSGLFLRNSTSPAFIRNNTIYGNIPYGIYVKLGQDPCLVNDIIWQNGVNVFSERGIEDINASFCCIEGGFPGIGNIDCDPCFRDTDADDYHLIDDSDCIDSGDPNFDDFNDIDIDGECRVLFGKTEIRVDMGADEYYWPKADIDRNGIVDFIDYSLWAQYWLTDDPNGRLDGDEDVDINDLAQFCDDWLWIAPELYQSFYNQPEDGGMSLVESFVKLPMVSIAEPLALTEDMTSDVVPGETPEIIDEPMSDEQIQELIDWSEELWQSSPDIREMVDPNNYQRVIESLREQLDEP